MRDYATLRDAIQHLGATLIEEHLAPESFGSACAVFKGVSGHTFRFVWDGKEEYGFLQIGSGADSWSDLSPRVFSANMQSRNVAVFLRLAQSVIANGVAV